jgi:hypothetical protein
MNLRGIVQMRQGSARKCHDSFDYGFPNQVGWGFKTVQFIPISEGFNQCWAENPAKRTENCHGISESHPPEFELCRYP